MTHIRDYLTFLALLGFLLISQLAGAQKDRWQSLDQLRSGNRVKVIDRHLKSYSGKFVRFSDSEITLLVQDQEVGIARADVARVTAVANNRKRNVLLGLAMGAGAGLGLGAAVLEREGNYSGAVAGAGVGFAGIGAGIGVLIPSDRTVYQADAVRR